MQIIAGTPNNSAHTNCFHFAFVKGKLYLAVGVNNSVIIYSHNLTTIQVILEQPFSSVSCISWQQETGKLAVCFESTTIYIYAPVFKKEASGDKVQWNKIQEIDNAAKTINCICWKPVITGNFLLASGSSIILWEITEEKDEETSVTSYKHKEEFKSDGNIVSVKYCSFSADGKYFITMGEYDRFIKVWYYNFNISRYTFVYLPHSKSVVTATWKRKKEGESSNILLTVCRNNIVRLWTESSINERLQFSVCCVIEPGPGTVVDWLNEPNIISNTTTTTSNANTTITTSNQSISRYSSLVPSAGNSLDWLVSIQKNGMVIIWKVKGLSDVPKHTPNFSIWSRFSVQSAPSMSTHLRLIGLASTFSSDSRICPVKFHLYVLSSSGAINCWECIEEGSINPRISSTLINCNIGHKGTIIHTIPHNKFPYVATIDQSQRCILWKTEPNMLIDLPFLLNYITTFDNTLLFAWTPSKNIVLTANNRGVFVYETDLISNENKNQNKAGNVPTATLMGLLADSDQFCPLLFLEVILPTIQPSNEDHQWQIVGIPENGDQICLWTMKSINSQSVANSSSNNNTGSGSTSPEGHKSPKQATMSFQIGQYITSFKTPSKILCVCTASHIQYSENSNKISLVTYSIDNTIRLWKITDNNEIELIATFNVDSNSPIHELHLSQHGYLAATTISGVVNVYYLDTSSNFKLIARESLTLNNNNNNNNNNSNNNNNNNSKVYSKWLNLMDGTSILETIQDKSVSLYNSKQSSKTFRSYELDWKKKEYYSTLLPGQCSTWLTDGTHICGASNQIYINTKWSAETSASSTLLHNYSNQTLPYPHYHPKILFEYLLSGNFKAVDYILKKLVNELNEISTSSNTSNAVKRIYQIPFEQVPVLAKSTNNDSNAKSTISSVSNTNNNTSSSLFSSQDQYDFLSSTTASSLSSLLTNSGISDDITSDSSSNNNNNNSKVEEEQAFTVSDAKILSEYLTSISLPNVSGSEQMYLLAIIDTFSQMQSTKGGIDESGVRYLLAYKIFSFLKRSLPPADRPTSLSSADFCWALHSEAEEALLQICFPSDGTWSTARSLGIGYWLRKPTILKNFIERLAKTQFSINKDPHDCALFYLALNKKPALVALFKAVKNTAVHDFMKNDFTTDKWKTAALKNAYVLLGKQKFELAAAFFLLGGQLKDAVDICIKKLADYQLALVIARLQENEPGPVFDYIINTHLLPLSLQSGDYTWASLLYWLIKKYNDSITVLLCNNNNNNNSSEDSVKKVEVKLVADPANQYLFQFLRGHTMLRESTLNFEDINLQLLKQTSLLYRETGYSLLVPSQIKEMLQILDAKKAKSASSSNNNASRGGGSMGFGYRPFRMAFMDPSESTPAPKKQTTETLDSALPFSIALQLLCQQIIGQSNVPLSQQQQSNATSKPVLRENFDFLTNYLQISPTVMLSSLLSFCETRFYVKPSFDLLWEESSYATRISLLLTYCQMIYNLLTHSSHFSTMSEEQLYHLYSLASQILECYNQIKEHLNPTENLYIRVSIQVGILIYTWMNQYYSTLAHILHMKDIKSMLALVEEDKTHTMDLSKQYEIDEQISVSSATSSSAQPTKTIAYGEVSIEYDEETVKYIDEILLLLVVKKYLNVIESDLQQTSGKAVEYFGYLNIWFYHIKQDTTDVPESFFNYIKSLKIAKDSTMLSIFYDAAKKSKKYKTNTNYKILWDYLAKEDLNNIFSEINFTIDVEHKTTNNKEEQQPINNNNKQHQEESVYKCMDVVSLYKDKDILQSFCVNNLDNLQIAVATTRGIKEISLSKGNLFEIYEESEPLESVGVELPKEDNDARNRQDAGLSNFLHKSVDKGKKVVTHSISKQIEYPVVAQWLESHPLHPYYLSGGIDGSLCLWQFNAQKENALMVTYKSSSNPRINKIHFNSRGTKFGSCDMSGKLSLWRFDANEASLRPFQILSCHTKRTLDFTFLNSGSVVASAGINYDKKNVAIWDTLKPPERSCVISFTAHEAGGASSVVYSARHQLLITGGKKGDIELFDLRQQKLLSSIKAHSMNVKSLAIDPEQQFILTGSSEGNAKLWDLPSVTQKECWEDIHMKHTFVRKPGVFSAPVSTFGVMQVLADKEFLYSCGSDGVLKRIQYTRSL